MPEQMAQQWARARSVEWAEQIIRARDVWVFQCEAGIAGWVSFTGSDIDGLYTDPAVAQRGVGSRLLTFAEAQIARAGAAEAHLEASWNSEEFYVKRGWTPVGPRPIDSARPMTKRLGSNKS
jgi:GNAT superfamily N-acetyltransferase